MKNTPGSPGSLKMSWISYITRNTRCGCTRLPDSRQELCLLWLCEIDERFSRFIRPYPDSGGCRRFEFATRRKFQLDRVDVWGPTC